MAGTSFFDLPPELRNEVYQYLKATYKSRVDVWIHEWKIREDFPYPITRTNKQIRQESSALFYKGVNIHFDMPDEQGYANCKEWLDIIHDSAIPAAGSFEVVAVNDKCKCQTACLVKVTIEITRTDRVKFDDVDGVRVQVPIQTFDAVVEVDGLGQKKKCWTESKISRLQAGVERKTRKLRPEDGMLKMSKDVLEAIMDLAAGK